MLEGYVGPTSALAEQRDRIRVASKLGDVVLDPFNAEPLVPKAGILRLGFSKRVRAGEPED
jgi:hypothetical protein